MHVTSDNEMSRFSLEDRVVVVTGCTGMLGSAYCRALSQRGTRLVMADLAERDTVTKAEVLAGETGTQILGVACDVGSEANVIALFETAMRHFGRVDVVLNNAAATGEHLMKTGEVFAPFEEYPLAVWDQVLRTNLTGVFLVAREGGKAMLASGGGVSSMSPASMALSDRITESTTACPLVLFLPTPQGRLVSMA